MRELYAITSSRIRGYDGLVPGGSVRHASRLRRLRTARSAVGSRTKPDCAISSFERGRAGHLGHTTTDASRLRLVQTVLDSTGARRLAGFYRSLLGPDYAEGDEPPAAGQPDERGRDWLVLRSPDGGPQLAFQQVKRLREPGWPDGPVPQQMHLGLSVASLEELRNQHERVLAPGGDLLSDRDRPDPDDEERFRVYRDPEGHRFCIFVTERDEWARGRTVDDGWTRLSAG